VDYARLGHRVIADDRTVTNEDFSGPLAGVFERADPRATRIRPGRTLRRTATPIGSAQRLLIALQKNGTHAAYAHDGQRPQPAFALLNTDLRSGLRNALHSGTRKMETWLTGIGACLVDFSDCPQAFVNINAPDDLRIHSS